MAPVRSPRPRRGCRTPSSAGASRTCGWMYSGLAAVGSAPLRSRWISSSRRSLPVRVGRAVEPGALGATLDVVHAGFGAGVVGIGLGRHCGPGVAGLGKRVLRQLAQVAVGHERVERARILPLVRVVLIDRVAHAEE